MASPKVNRSYLRLYKEIPLFIRASFIKKGNTKPSGRVLIVNTCLVGDFVASLPAIRQFIKKTGVKVDLIVSPPTKVIAEKVLGVKNVYIAESVFSRDLERADRQIEDWNGHQGFDMYDMVIIMRISDASYAMIKDIHAKEIRTALVPYVKYALLLLKNSIMKRQHKQYRELNFEILDGKDRPVPFENIFEFNRDDYAAIDKLEQLQTDERIVIVHTGSSWPMMMWDDKKWVKLLRQINALGNVRFVFIGAKDEEGDYKRIAAQLDFKVYSLINKINLKDLLLVLRRSDFFIGVDSGPRNIAHLANIRSVVLLGPGPHVFMPQSDEDIVIDKSEGKGLYERFIYKKRNIMQKITVDDVYHAFHQLAENTKRVEQKT